MKFAVVLLSVLASVVLAAAPLTRIPTTELAADFAVRAPSAELDCSAGLTVAVPEGDAAALTERVRKRLADAWKLPIAARPVANHHDGAEPLLLAGPANSSMLMRELAANEQIPAAGSGFRVIPEVLDWKRGAIVFFGGDAAALDAALDAFLTCYPTPAGLKFSGSLVPKRSYPAPEQLTAAAAKTFAGREARQINNVILNELRQAALGWRDTGDGRYARAFAEISELLRSNYRAKLEFSRNAPPTFEFHTYAQLLFLVEHAPEFTAADRRNAAELIRTVLEDTMNFWEMTTPAKMYADNTFQFLTNHYLFAARTTWNSVRYLRNRSDFPAAAYWGAVAEHVFRCVEDHPLSPEDAGGYQFLVYRIFTDYAIASGRYSLDFFRRSAYLDAVAFARGIVNHLGYTPGYGDANATGMAGGWTLLTDAADILGDEEAKRILALIARKSPNDFFRNAIAATGVEREQPLPTGDTGLRIFELDRYRQELCQYPSFPRPVLSKAIFRGGWDEKADFLVINGLTAAPHGHDDATGISQYIDGEHLWLWEGDYIRRHAEDHNVLQLIRNGEAPDRRRFFRTSPQSKAAQLLGSAQAPDRSRALLSLLLADYNGADQRRHIGWERGDGFWIIDEVTAKRPGDYLLLHQLRTTGTVTPQTQGFTVGQSTAEPSVTAKLAVAEGTGAEAFLLSRFDSCHGRVNGQLAGYRYSDQNTRKLLFRRQVKLAAGERSMFFSFIRPQGAEEFPVVKMIAPNAALAECGGLPRLAVTGALRLPEFELDAAVCFVSPRGILASGVKRAALGGRAWTPDADGNLAVTFSPAEAAAMRTTLARAAAGVKPATSEKTPRVTVPQGSVAATLNPGAPVTALAVRHGRIAAGLQNGDVVWYDAAGRELFRRNFGREISVLEGVTVGGKALWLAGVRAPRNATGSGDLHCLDADGNTLWSRSLPPFQTRYGTPTVLFTAHLDGKDAPETIIVGVEAQHYFAFDAAGAERWRYQCTHGATAGAAADLNGDDFDEIFVGNEYYTHDIIDRHGKRLSRRTTSPWDGAVVATDLNGDGKLEAVAARFDGYLYLDGTPGNPLIGRNANLGGRPAGIAVWNSGKNRLATLSTSGVAAFFDSALKRTSYLTLPAPAAALAVGSNDLLAACEDGALYRFRPGKITRQYHYTRDANTPRPPMLKSDDALAAVAHGTSITIIPLM